MLGLRRRCREPARGKLQGDRRGGADDLRDSDERHDQLLGVLRIRVRAPTCGNVQEIDGLSNNYCAIRSDAAVLCWGNGELEAPPGSFKSVGVGFGYACAVATTGVLECWGEEEFGEASPPDGNFSIVSASYDYACAIAVGGTIVCWGNEEEGEAPPAGTFVDLAVMGRAGCGIRSDGSLECWGDWRGIDPPPGTYKAVEEGLGGSFCAIRADDRVVCWGSVARQLF